MKDNERIKQIEDRVARLEEEVRTLTSALRGTAPVVPISPWKSMFEISDKTVERHMKAVVGMADIFREGREKNDSETCTC